MTAKDIAIRNNDPTFLNMLENHRCETLRTNLSNANEECYNLRSRKRKADDDLTNMTEERDSWRRRCNTMKDNAQRK